MFTEAQVIEIAQLIARASAHRLLVAQGGARDGSEYHRKGQRFLKFDSSDRLFGIGAHMFSSKTNSDAFFRKSLRKGR